MLGCWIDGLQARQVPVSDRALHYGDAAFTTIRVHQSRPCWMADHIRRLREAIHRLQLPELDTTSLVAEIERAAATVGVGVVKVLLSRGDGGRGYSPEGARGRRMVLAYAPVETPDDRYQSGIAVRIARIRLSEQPVLAGIKHANRLEQVMAMSEPEHRDVQEALMLDSLDRIVSATAGNVFLRFGNVLGTPSLERSGVSGVCRNHVLGQNLPGIRMLVSDWSVSQLQDADEVFICNAVRGIMPVAKLGDRIFPEHPSAHALMRRIHPGLGLPLPATTEVD